MLVELSTTPHLLVMHSEKDTSLETPLNAQGLPLRLHPCLPPKLRCLTWTQGSKAHHTELCDTSKVPAPCIV